MFGHIHLLLLLDALHILLFPTSYFRFSYLLCAINALRMRMNVGSSSGSWATHGGPHP